MSKWQSDRFLSLRVFELEAISPLLTTVDDVDHYVGHYVGSTSHLERLKFKAVRYYKLDAL